MNLINANLTFFNLIVLQKYLKKNTVYPGYEAN